MSVPETDRGPFPPSQRDTVRFYVAKSLPYARRMWLALGLFVVAGAIQVATLNVFFGVPFLVAAVLLVITKGYDSRVRLKGYDIDPAWKPVPIEKIRELEELRKRAKRWDRDAYEASNPLGCLILVLLNVAIVAVAVVLGAVAGDARVGGIIAVDALVILWAFWLTGMRRLLKLPNLAIRARLVLDLHERFRKLAKEGEVFQPALRLARGREGGTVPTDVRFSVRFPGSPEGFYGVQAQINLNVVQGTSYPYFYCVLAAKPGFGLAAHRDRISLADKVICEYQQSDGAEVLVIRQKTSKTSGYHTDPKACERILSTALHAGRSVCGAPTGS